MTETEKIEMLMRPRIKVIAPWPDMGDRKYYVGEILVLTNQNGSQPHIERGVETLYDAFFDVYPHLFRTMPWYEEREVWEMPEYVRDSTGVYKVRGWRKNKDELWWILEVWGFGCRSDEWKDFYIHAVAPHLTAATLTDYQSYLNRKK